VTSVYTLVVPADIFGVIGYTDATLTDDVLEKDIDYWTAYLFSRINRTITAMSSSTNDYLNAQGAICNFVAWQCMLRLSGGNLEGLKYKVDEFSVDKTKQLDIKPKTGEKYLKTALMFLETLRVDAPDYPRSTTQED
jgi:hypothetical protein